MIDKLGRNPRVLQQLFDLGRVFRVDLLSRACGLRADCRREGAKDDGEDDREMPRVLLVHPHTIGGTEHPGGRTKGAPWPFCPPSPARPKSCEADTAP